MVLNHIEILIKAEKQNHEQNKEQKEEKLEATFLARHQNTKVQDKDNLHT